MFRADQRTLRAALPDWEFEQVVAGRRVPWPAGSWLAPPVHEVYGRSDAVAVPELEILLNERDDSAWVYRRDPVVRRELTRAVRVTASGLPALAPEIVLLYKSKALRPVDLADFASGGHSWTWRPWRGSGRRCSGRCRATRGSRPSAR